MRSPASRTNGDWALLIHLAALAGPVRSAPDDLDGAWGRLSRAQGPAASRASLARAVFGTDTGTSQARIGQSLLRLRGMEGGGRRPYDPPLLDVWNAEGRLLGPRDDVRGSSYVAFRPRRVYRPERPSEGVPTSEPDRLSDFDNHARLSKSDNRKEEEKNPDGPDTWKTGELKSERSSDEDGVGWVD